MTNLRQAAQQALEALVLWEDEAPHAWSKADEEAVAALRAALAEPEQEPVGHADLGINNIYIFSALEPRVIPVGRTPLYTAPAPRKPLPEEEIVRLMVGEDRVQLLYAKPDDPYFSEFAQGAIRELVESGRAIERAHGIGEQHGS